MIEERLRAAAAATAIELGLTRSANFAGCRYRRKLSMSRKRTDEPDSSQGGVDQIKARGCEKEIFNAFTRSHLTVAKSGEWQLATIHMPFLSLVKTFFWPCNPVFFEGREAGTLAGFGQN